MWGSDVDINVFCPFSLPFWSVKGTAGKTCKIQLETLILEGHVGVNTGFSTLSGSKLKKKKGSKDIIQSHIKNYFKIL